MRTVILKYKLSGETKYHTVDRPVQEISITVSVEELTRLDPSVSEFVSKQEQ